MNGFARSPLHLAAAASATPPRNVRDETKARPPPA
jgi:hypothetical protein